MLFGELVIYSGLPYLQICLHSVCFLSGMKLVNKKRMEKEKDDFVLTVAKVEQS